jgi:indole-3-glycerol phosphate synthase
MNNILQTLAVSAAERMERDKAAMPLSELITLARRSPSSGFAFEHALKPVRNAVNDTAQMAFICEVKRASPSKGLIAAEFPYLEIARDYEAAGAAAISVLTEPTKFLGSNEYLREIAAAVSVPVLRKDFTVDAYQIYQAKTLGASAVLLICALLDTAQLKAFIELADELGLSALVEAHDEREVDSALAANARVIGVNNRDLKTFNVDAHNCLRLRGVVPPNVTFVAESGIKSRADVELLEQNGVDAVLIGETLMRAPDRKVALAALRANL